VLAVAVAELALRITAPSAFYVWPPGLQQTFVPDPRYLPGVSGISHFHINSAGMRADEPTAQDAGGILAVGGSTTEGLFLDDAEAWPRVLQDELSTPGHRVVVANVGKSGHRTRQHVLQVERLLPQHPGFRTVILLAGVNDLQRALQGESIANEPIGPQDYASAFMVYPGHVAVAANAPFYRKTQIFALLNGLRRVEVPVTAPVQDVYGQFYQTFRERRRRAPRAAGLPDLSIALAEYRRDLSASADVATRNGVRLVLATQPALWRRDLPPDLEALTWFGWSQTREYYATADLAEAMDRYNDVLLGVCRERGLDCVDLASQLPKDTTVFYDDCHFNEEGARRVAKLLADHLQSRL
jgi:lysophospholipase L1-like esterase